MEQPDPAIEVDDAALTRLVRFAYLTCRDTSLAQDLTQEALYRVLSRRNPKPIDSPEAYVRATIVNVYLAWGRRKSSGEQPLNIRAETATDGFEERVLDQAVIWDALETLSKRQRAVLMLRFYADLSDKQIAADLGWRESTVRSLAARGLKSLADQPHVRSLRPLPLTSQGSHD